MQAQHFSFRAMASPCEITVADAPSPELARDAALAAMSEVQRIERKFSRFDPNSVLSTINREAAFSTVPVDDETRALLQHAGDVYAISGGLFDATSGCLQEIWDFRGGVVPTPEQRAQALARCGWPHVRLGPQGVGFDAVGVRLDLGGFGKEYAADRAADALQARGLRSGFVNLGGDIRVLGPKPDGQAWQFGIRHPRDPQRPMASIAVHEGALATSGDYERYFEQGGRRYCHVLSPRDAMPVTHWRSVSVQAPLAVVAGVACTVAMLMQADGLAFLHDGGWPFLAVDHNGDVHTHATSLQHR